MGYKYFLHFQQIIFKILLISSIREFLMLISIGFEVKTSYYFSQTAKT